MPLGHVVAAAAAPEFGQAQDQAIWALKERAEFLLLELFVSPADSSQDGRGSQERFPLLLLSIPSVYSSPDSATSAPHFGY